MSQLNDIRIIVTGGSRGFGRGMVEALTAEGATVYALARDVGTPGSAQTRGQGRTNIL